MNMYQLQQFHLPMMKVDMKKRERNKGMEKERLQVMDLSGMSLESLPKPSLDLATICKLDLSNNNLQVFLHIYSYTLIYIFRDFQTNMNFLIIQIHYLIIYMELS